MRIDDKIDELLQQQPPNSQERPMTAPNKKHGDSDLASSSSVESEKLATKQPVATSKKWLAIVYAALVLAFALGFWLTDVRSDDFRPLPLPANSQ